MSIDKKIENLAEEILQEYTNCYSEVDKEVLAKMISKAIPSKQSEWISVEERLPEVYDPCLVAIRVDEGVKIDLGERIKCYNACKMEHYEEWCLTTTDYGEITHWMPLPEAPKMKGE